MSELYKNEPSKNEPSKIDLSNNDLSQLEFVEASRAISNPDDLLSSTLNSLILQNEDLNAKYLVAIKKNAFSEALALSAQKNLSELEKRNSILEEQLLLSTEKEKSWMKRLEQARNKIAEHTPAQEELEKAKKQILRYQRYQTRIKNQVAPYVQDLKSYAHNLKNKYLQIEQSLTLKDTQISKIKEEFLQLNDTLTRVQQQTSEYKKQLLEAYNKDKQSFIALIEELKLDNKALQEKSKNVDLAYFRQNELENQLLKTRRELSETNEQLKIELSSKSQVLEKTRVELSALSFQNQELIKLHSACKQTNHQQEIQLQQFTDQLSQLRIQWKDKIQDYEKLLDQKNSLDKINQDLAKKLNSTSRPPRA